MSLATRALIIEHRRRLTEGPDGLIRARDDRGVVHVVNREFAGLPRTGCDQEVMDEDGLAVLLPRAGNAGPVRQALTCTWDEVDCIACLASSGWP